MSWRTVLLGLVVWLLPGCVSLQHGGIFPEGRNHVFVSYFDNATFYRDVQFLLSEQIVREIDSTPGLWLSSKDDAEVLLSGRVTKVSQQDLSENPNQLVTSSSTNITVKIQIHDARTGQLIRETTLSQRGDFVPALGEDLSSAQRQAFRFLARDVVRQLEAEF